MNLAESLRKYTTVVADTGDIEAIARHLRRMPQPTPLFSITRPKCPPTAIWPRRPPGRPSSVVGATNTWPKTSSIGCLSCLGARF